MSFVVMEFEEDCGGGLATVKKNWMTPRQKEVFWPPIKDQKKFNKLLLSETEICIEDTWKLYKVSRIFYESDDYEAAQKKLNLAKVTSDLSEHEIEDNKKRRRPTKIYSTDDEDDEKNYWRSRVQKKHKSCNLPSLLPPPPVELITSRPPPLNQSTSCTTSTKDTSSLEFVFDDTPFAQSPSVQLTQELITTRPLPDHQSTPSRRGATSTASLDFVFDRTAYEVLLSHILVVKEQNKQILAILNKKSENVLPTLPELQVDLPMKNHEAIDKFEAELQNEEVMKSFGSYLATLGGRDLTTSTNRVLRYLLTDSLAADYSYFGKKGKRAFVDLKTFNKLIFGSLKLTYQFAKEKDIEDAVKVWLKHAPERVNIRAKKLTTNN